MLYPLGTEIETNLKPKMKNVLIFFANLPISCTKAKDILF
jgi:hypothetical protein